MMNTICQVLMLMLILVLDFSCTFACQLISNIVEGDLSHLFGLVDNFSNCNNVLVALGTAIVSF